jgi:hypothetical protein
VRDVEVDAVKRDDLAEELADAARASREPSRDTRRPTGEPVGRRALFALSGYRETR